MRRIVAMTGLVAIAALSLAVAGCNNASNSKVGTTAETTDPAAAKQALSDAAAKLGKTTFKITLTTGGFTGSGVADPAARKSRLSIGGSGSAAIELVMIRTDLWMKMPGLPVAEGKWMHLDSAKLAAGSRLNALGRADDPGGTQALVKAIADVRSVGEDRYQGTLDLSKSASSRFLTKTLKDQGLSPDLLIVPFEAAVDDQGRLISLTVDQSALMKAVAGDMGAAANKVEMRFSDFGVAVDAKAPPADEVTEIPKAVLDAIGG